MYIYVCIYVYVQLVFCQCRASTCAQPAAVPALPPLRPKAAPPLLWRRPKAASIMVDGEVANIGKTYANMYRIFMYVYISHIL